MEKNSCVFLKWHYHLFALPDPLHPHDSGYLRSLFRRKFTTISTFGESIGFLIDAVDNLIVNYVNGFKKDLDKQRAS